MTEWQLMVREFHEKFGQPVRAKPKCIEWQRIDTRNRWVDSELDEMDAAAASYDLPGTADGIVDAIYFLIGSAVEMGIDLDPLFRAVHAANMTKYRVPGDPKIRKPVNFTPPDIAAELMKQGWKP